MNALLGIDLGTSAVKTVLLDPQTGESLALAGAAYPINRPAPGWAEQNPEDWWRAVVRSVLQAVDAAGQPEVRAIGFSGQMHGTVLLGADSLPLHPAIIWADQRSAPSSRALREILGDQVLLFTTGTLPAAGFQGPTLHWLAENEPALLARTHRVLLPKDYIRFRMDGEVATDFSDAAGTGIFDIRARTWAWDLIKKIGIPEGIFPPPMPSTANSGELAAGVARELDLKPGIPVFAGCGDQPAQAVGNGVIAPGTASLTVGSGGQVFAPLHLSLANLGEKLQPDPRLHLFNHAVPDNLYVLGAILSAGLSLHWLRGLVGLGSTPQAYEQLSAEASAVPPGADGLIFLPYLSGERTPHMDPRARGAFIGLTAAHSRAHLARAVMEGVAMALRQALEISLAVAGPVETLTAAGGGAASPVWRGILADVLGLPLRQSLLPEQAAVGAALIAGVGVGIYRDFPAACRAAVRYGPLTPPDRARAVRYDELYGIFVEQYPLLRGDFHRLDGFNRVA